MQFLNFRMEFGQMIQLKVLAHILAVLQTSSSIFPRGAWERRRMEEIHKKGSSTIKAERVMGGNRW